MRNAEYKINKIREGMNHVNESDMRELLNNFSNLPIRYRLSIGLCAKDWVSKLFNRQVKIYNGNSFSKYLNEDQYIHTNKGCEDDIMREYSMLKELVKSRPGLWDSLLDQECYDNETFSEILSKASQNIQRNSDILSINIILPIITFKLHGVELYNKLKSKNSLFENERYLSILFESFIDHFLSANNLTDKQIESFGTVIFLIERELKPYRFYTDFVQPIMNGYKTNSEIQSKIANAVKKLFDQCLDQINYFTLLDTIMDVGADHRYEYKHFKYSSYINNNERSLPMVKKYPPIGFENGEDVAELSKLIKFIISYEIPRSYIDSPEYLGKIEYQLPESYLVYLRHEFKSNTELSYFIINDFMKVSVLKRSSELPSDNNVYLLFMAPDSTQYKDKILGISIYPEKNNERKFIIIDEPDDEYECFTKLF